MRAIALMAGLAIAVAAIPAASQAACQKRPGGSIIDALIGPRCDRAPGRTDQRTHALPRPTPKRAPYLAQVGCPYGEPTAYDAGGQVISQPSRLCGRS